MEGSVVLMADAFPLQWPSGWQRSKYPESARFHRRQGQYGQRNITHHEAARFLILELERLEASSFVLSSNLSLKLDGTPYSNQRKPEDVGVVVYFVLNGKEQCIPCDKWDRPEDNVYAIAKTIEALRGIERWGAKEMLNAAFSGFKALPSPDQVIVTHNYFNYFIGEQTKESQKVVYRELLKKYHPDNQETGDTDKFAEIQRQWRNLD